MRLLGDNRRKELTNRCRQLLQEELIPLGAHAVLGKCLLHPLSVAMA
jgi:hypothetical protein